MSFSYPVKESKKQNPSQYLVENFIRSRNCFEKCGDDGNDDVEILSEDYHDIYEVQEVYRKCGCLLDKKKRILPQPICRTLEYYLFPVRPLLAAHSPRRPYEIVETVCKPCYDMWVGIELDSLHFPPVRVFASCLPVDEEIPFDLKPFHQFHACFPFDRRRSRRHPCLVLATENLDDINDLKCAECGDCFYKDVLTCDHCDPTMDLDLAFMEEDEEPTDHIEDDIYNENYSK